MLTALMVLLRSLGLIYGGHRAVVLENLALRQQLAVLTRTVKRPQFRSTDRLFWILLAKGWRDWRSALVVVQPDTVSDGTANGFAGIGPGFHDGGIQAAQPRVRPFAPSSARWPPRIRCGARRESTANWPSCASRSRSGPCRGSYGDRGAPSQTWRTFLTNHVATLVSMDFFTVPTLTGRVLFVLVLLSHQRRRIIHVNITEHPTALWAARQMIEAFPDDTAPRWLLRDRDTIYGDVFRRRVASMDIGEVISAPSSPWQNPYAERLIGSIRRECLNHVIVLGERHLRRLLTAYLNYYHGARTHLALEKDAPTPRRVQTPTEGRVVAFPEVGGLHHRYERRAA
jgi:putative transposase